MQWCTLLNENEQGFEVLISVSVSFLGSCSLISNGKLSSSASDEEMNMLVSILAAVRTEPCRLAFDDILLQGKLYLAVVSVHQTLCTHDTIFIR